MDPPTDSDEKNPLASTRLRRPNYGWGARVAGTVVLAAGAGASTLLGLYGYLAAWDSITHPSQDRHGLVLAVGQVFSWAGLTALVATTAVGARLRYAGNVREATASHTAGGWPPMAAMGVALAGLAAANAIGMAAAPKYKYTTGWPISAGFAVCSALVFAWGAFAEPGVDAAPTIVPVTFPPELAGEKGTLGLGLTTTF